MFDYVRFPSDGDIANAVYPGKTSVSEGSRHRRLRRVREESGWSRAASVSRPRSSASRRRVTSASARYRGWISKNVDSISPMSYPVLYGGGELGLKSPSTQPGETVFRTLTDFRRQVKGSRAQLVPWVQDWNYTPQQVLAADRGGAPPGREGLPALERLGDLHESRARPRGTHLEG